MKFKVIKEWIVEAQDPDHAKQIVETQNIAPFWVGVKAPSPHTGVTRFLEKWEEHEDEVRRYERWKKEQRERERQQNGGW